MSEQSSLTRAAPGTPDAAFEFLDMAKEEGELKPETVKALRNATYRILSVDPRWQTFDLRTLDLDHQFARFEETIGEKYAEGSLKNYKSRFQQTVEMYRAWMRNENDWKRHGPGTRSPKFKWTRDQLESIPEVSELIAPPTTISAPAPTPTNPIPEPGSAATSRRLMQHTYPLREDVDVQLQLPRDLTTVEANRLAKFISTLAWDDAPPTGGNTSAS